jgi:S-DNA-T family DNA segregation ATPase FtsK/SpoIIIE
VAPPIRQLPLDVNRKALPDHLEEPDLVPFGIREDTMGAALLELSGTDQHLVALGDTGSGRTTLLRTIAAGLVERHPDPEDLRLAVMDMRGGLAEAVPDAYLAAHATHAGQAVGLIETLSGVFLDRMEQLTAAPRGAKPVFPRVVIMVDDHDMITAGIQDPLANLVQFLPSARDLNLNVILARPVAGAGNTVYDAVLQGLRNNSGSTLVLSGDRAEGQILQGVRAEPLPPGRARWVRRSARTVQVHIARDQEARG